MKNYQTQIFSVKYNLGELKKRLKKGMVIKGRILDCADGNRYILRVWNYNIYTESKENFEKNDEIELTVKQIEPNLVFDMHQQNSFVDPKNKQTDILI
ncbi:MAG: hypothetical protein JXQ65_07730 [Candidatus Marinimicrobia bacterium]|nr:hypothetical protein [Candidatus Neomarinimicrobiota bacterium]